MSSIRELFRELGGLFRWWVVVAPWEQAVRVRMGKHVCVLDAGVHLRVPFVDRVFRQSVRRRFSSIPTQTVTTRDGRTVTVSGTMGYAIADIGKLYNTLHHAEDTITSEGQGLISRFIARSDFADCLPAAIEVHVTEHLDLKRYGLAGMEFFVTDFAAVRTYRLIQGEPKDWSHGDSLTTNLEDGAQT